MSTIPLPSYTAEVGQAPTNVPGTPAAAGLLPYTNFNDADIVARGYAQILARTPTAAEASARAAAEVRDERADKRAELEFWRDTFNDVAKVVMAIGDAERKAQEKEDRMAALRIYEDYRTKLDTVEVNADQAYARHRDYLGTVEVSRGKLMQEAYAKAENEQQKLFLEAHVTPYNIESRRAVLKNAASKRVEGMVADANVTIQAETSRLVASESPAELKSAADVIEETYQHLVGIVPADKVETMRQTTVRQALKDRLDREVRENPELLLVGRLKAYEPGGQIASLFPTVPLRADEIAKAREDATARVKTLVREANAADTAARKVQEDALKDGVTQSALSLYGVMVRGGSPYQDPALRAQLEFVTKYSWVLGLDTSRTIQKDLLSAAAGEYPAPGQEAAVLVGIYTGTVTDSKTILDLQGLKPEAKISLIEKFYERQKSFPYNTEQYSTGVRMITRSVLGVDPDAASRAMMPGLMPDSRVAPEAAAQWRAALLDFYSRARGVKEGNLGDLLKYADEISVRYTPKKRTAPAADTERHPPQDPSSSSVPPTSTWRGYTPPQ